MNHILKSLKLLFCRLKYYIVLQHIFLSWKICLIIKVLRPVVFAFICCAIKSRPKGKWEAFVKYLYKLSEFYLNLMRWSYLELNGHSSSTASAGNIEPCRASVFTWHSQRLGNIIRYLYSDIKERFTTEFNIYASTSVSWRTCTCEHERVTALRIQAAGQMGFYVTLQWISHQVDRRKCLDLSATIVRLLDSVRVKLMILIREKSWVSRAGSGALFCMVIWMKHYFRRMNE